MSRQRWAWTVAVNMTRSPGTLVRLKARSAARTCSARAATLAGTVAAGTGPAAAAAAVTAAERGGARPRRSSTVRGVGAPAPCRHVRPGAAGRPCGVGGAGVSGFELAGELPADVAERLGAARDGLGEPGGQAVVHMCVLLVPPVRCSLCACAAGWCSLCPPWGRVSWDAGWAGALRRVRFGWRRSPSGGGDRRGVAGLAGEAGDVTAFRGSRCRRPVELGGWSRPAGPRSGRGGGRVVPEPRSGRGGSCRAGVQQQGPGAGLPRSGFAELAVRCRD